MPGNALGSDWGELNRDSQRAFLLAQLVPARHIYDANGDRWEGEPDADWVYGPLSEGNLDTTLQWNSPFEAIGAESKLPLLSGLLQSGAGQSVLNALGSMAESFTSAQTDALLQSFKNDASKVLLNLEGAAGITRLNSTQIFSGMQPLKFNVTMHFRAWKDAAKEVQQPIDQLMEWVLPQELSKVGFLESLAKEGSIVRALFPSRAPRVLSFSYGGSTILPVVIENVGQPLVTGREANGLRTNVAVQLSIATLAAIDRNDWKTFNF